MYRFWETLLFDKHSYSGSPYPKHGPLKISAANFDQWVSIFTATVDDLFKGEIAEKAKFKGETILNSFRRKYSNHKTRYSVT